MDKALLTEKSIDDLKNELKELHKQKRDVSKRIREYIIRERKTKGIIKGQDAPFHQSEKPLIGKRTAREAELSTPRFNPKRHEPEKKLGSAIAIDLHHDEKEEKKLSSAVQRVEEEKPRDKNDKHDEKERNSEHKERDEKGNRRMISLKKDSSKNLKHEENDKRNRHQPMKDTKDEELDVRNVKLPTVQMPETVVKRNKNLFNSMLNHLKRAKTTLEQEKEHFDKQGKVVKKVDEEIKKSSLDIKEQQITEIDEKKKREVKHKHDIDRKLLIVNEELWNKKIVTHYEKLSNFIRTKEGPPVMWIPCESNEKCDALVKETKQVFQKKIEDFKIDAAEHLQKSLADFDKRIKELEERGTIVEHTMNEEQLKVDEKQPMEDEEEDDDTGLRRKRNDDELSEEMSVHSADPNQ